MAVHTWRKRGIYLAAAGGLILLGLASRAFGNRLPDWAASNAGDALWAAMVYAGVRACLPHRTVRAALLISLAFAWAIEFSQLYQAAWISGLRRTTLGALVLGRGFLWVDLARYAAGIAAAAALDGWAQARCRRKPQPQGR